MRKPSSLLALALAAGFLLSGCADEPLSCGEGTYPVIVTSLSGYLDDVVPAVEVQLRVPETCEVLDTRWMLWQEETETVTLADYADLEGTLHGGGVETGDDVIGFTNADVYVNLIYPEPGVQAPEVTLTWSFAGTTLATVDCAANGEALECSVRAP